MSGWIKIHRSILNHWLYTEKRKFSKFEAWQDLLLNVNFSDAKTIIKGKLYDVKRGQSILSLDSWSKRWNWDKSSVRRFFNLLEKDNMIIVKSDNITTHLTICKYEDYQQKENANETQTTRRRNANEIQTTIQSFRYVQYVQSFLSVTQLRSLKIRNSSLQVKFSI